MQRTSLKMILPAIAAAAAFCPAAYAAGHRTHSRTAMPHFIWHRYGRASAVAPADWVIISNGTGNGVDLWNPQHSEYAGWSISAVTPQMMMFYPIYRNPEASLTAGLTMVAKGQGDPSGVHLTSAPKPVGDGFFTLRTFESNRKSGLVLYHIYPLAGGGFIASIFETMANKPEWAKHKAMLVSMALSIHSTVMLTPTPSDSGKKSVGEQDKELKGYNAQLGTQWVHNPNTGDIYDMDASSEHDGPDGYGYYHNGVKLETGLGDD